ncbi:MAG: hypothetical protein M3Y58_10415 [Chloroflexota bacterium]|nr:hypothetical protein [Chloroflexota bacterium]
MRRDILDTHYTLRKDDTPLVQCGDTVAAGAVIAVGSGPPAILAYAATLRLSEEAAREAIARFDDTPCTAGDSLGTHRVGLTTRKIRAPASGLVRGIPQSGALAIRDARAEFPHHARYGGCVHNVSRREITIRSAIARCGYACADGRRTIGSLSTEPALLGGAVTEKALPQSSSASSIVVAHIADTAHLRAVIQSFHGTLIVGSMAESVAWALLDRSQTSASGHANDAGIIVLYGVGDVQHGARTVAPLRHFPGAHLLCDRFTQTLTVIPTDGALPEFDEIEGSYVR